MVEIDPRNAEIYYAYGETMNRAGEQQRALLLLDLAFSIDTFVPPGWEFAKGHSFVLLERHEEALDHILPVLQRVPRLVPARVQLARTYAEMGDMDNARKAVHSILQIAPRYNVASSQKMFPCPAACERARLTDNLRAAGLPE